MNYFFNREFKPSTLEDFVRDTNDIPNGEGLNVYLFSPIGGNVSLAYMFKDILENYSSDVTLIGCGHLYSAGLIAFLLTDVPKFVLDGTIGMWHRPYIDSRVMTYSGEAVKDAELVATIASEENCTEQIERIIQPTKKELASLNRGDDIFLTTGKLKEMLITQNNQEKGQ